MPDAAYSDAIADEATPDAKSNVFNIQKKKSSLIKTKSKTVIELVESTDTTTLKSNNSEHNKNVNKNQNFRSKKNVIEELNNNKHNNNNSNNNNFLATNTTPTEPIESHIEEEEEEEGHTKMSRNQGSYASSPNMANKLVLYLVGW